MDKVIISVKDLYFLYENAKEPVLRGIDMDIEKGSMTAILGRNGSGKSTLAKHFNALLLPSKGRVYVDGMDTSKEENAVEIRKKAGMVFQNPDNQFVTSIVEDDVAFAPENLCMEPAEIRGRVYGALEAVGMSEYAKSAISTLSGGQKQKIAAAGVLAMEPEILILDEATAMLDPKGRAELIEMVKRLNREKGITVVLITHFMEEAAECDRVIVLDKGQIAMDGTPRAVFSEADRMAKLGLDVPQVTRLAAELKKYGIEIRSDIITAEECEKELRKLLKNHKGVSRDKD